MQPNHIILKVSNDRIYFNPLLSVPIQHTNIPYQHLKFQSHVPIYWEVEMDKYFPDNECLRVIVRDYNTDDIQNFDSQKPKKEIKYLRFDNFDWKNLEPLLISYQKIKLPNALINIESDSFSSTTIQITGTQKSNFSSSQSFNQSTQKETPIITTINEEFSIYFTEARFKLGYVTFDKHIKKLRKVLNFKIPNEYILAEFDNVKFWFAKKLKTKKFKVSIVIKMTDRVITETSAYSRQIDQITPELIDSVKYQRTIALTKVPIVTNPDKSLFTTEEIFTLIDSEVIEGNVFNQSEDDILKFFIGKYETRNKKQLAYLSGNKQSVNYKLNYTLYPNFGFLFFIEGSENNHFVWELLNSHATYIWSIEKGQQKIDLQVKRIEAIIHLIRTIGRETYKREYRNIHQDSDLVFRVISHKDIASKRVDGFPKWKSKLNEQLT